MKLFMAAGLVLLYNIVAEPESAGVALALPSGLSEPGSRSRQSLTSNKQLVDSHKNILGNVESDIQVHSMNQSRN